MYVLSWVMMAIVHRYLSSAAQSEKGCKQWRESKQTEDVCCDICYAGNRVVKECGPNPGELCTPCEPDTYTLDPKPYECKRCTQCIGARVMLKECTSDHDTVCGCKKGLRCGNAACSFCVEECGQGQEPTENRSCRACPNETFNDQIHQACKPWSKSCPRHGDIIIAQGDAFSDIKCNTSVPLVKMVKKYDADILLVWPVVGCVSFLLVVIIIVMTITLMVKTNQKIKTIKKTMEKSPEPIIRTPTDEPRTLIAEECSFHESEQEQGVSTESLHSKYPLIV